MLIAIAKMRNALNKTKNGQYFIPHVYGGESRDVWKKWAHPLLQTHGEVQVIFLLTGIL
jgi:hypothetical protein